MPIPEASARLSWKRQIAVTGVMAVLLLGSLAFARFAGHASAPPPRAGAHVLEHAAHRWVAARPEELEGLHVPPNALLLRDPARTAHFAVLNDMTYRGQIDPLAKLSQALANAPPGPNKLQQQVTAIRRDDGVALLRLGVDLRQRSLIKGVLVLTPNGQHYRIVYVYDALAEGEDPEARLRHLQDDLKMFGQRLEMPGGQ